MGPDGAEGPELSGASTTGRAGLGLGGAAGGRLAAGLLGPGRGLGGEALALEGLEALELLVEVGAALGELVEGGLLLAERGLEGLAGDGGVLGLGAVLVDGVGVGLGDEAHQGLGLDLAVEVVAEHQLVAGVGRGADVGLDDGDAGAVGEGGEAGLGGVDGPLGLGDLDLEPGEGGLGLGQLGRGGVGPLAGALEVPVLPGGGRRRHQHSASDGHDGEEGAQRRHVGADGSRRGIHVAIV